MVMRPKTKGNEFLLISDFIKKITYCTERKRTLASLWPPWVFWEKIIIFLVFGIYDSYWNTSHLRYSTERILPFEVIIDILWKSNFHGVLYGRYTYLGNSMKRIRWSLWWLLWKVYSFRNLKRISFASSHKKCFSPPWKECVFLWEGPF